MRKINFYQIKKRLLQLLIVSVICYPLYANDKLKKEFSFDQAIQYALANNKQVAIAKFEIEFTKADRITAGLRPNPFLNIVADVLPFNPTSKQFDPNRNQYGVSLGFVIETANKREERINVANKRLKMDELVFLETLRKMSITTGNLFIATLAARERYLLAEENYKNLVNIVEINRIRFKKEDISKLELLRSEVAQDQYAVARVSAQVEYIKLKNELIVFLGLNPSEIDIVLSGNLDSLKLLPQIDANKLLKLATEGRPDYLALVNAEDIALANMKLQRANAVPNFSILFDSLVQQNQYMYGMSANLELPVFSRNQGEIAKSESARKQAAIFREELYLNLAKEMAITEEEIKVRFEALEQMRQISLLKSQQAVKIVELAYKGGGSTLLEFLDTTRSYNETKLKYIDALVEYEKALLNLKYITGFDYEPN
ncbi:TolC family protein [Leptospira levettii]|uniref:TolC family protein n=1 Tax=Leptospira levettii TaxID=2023178 RepID=A0A5R2BTB5_9LEPT|nr:TolC family protein [Leptospira levettii]MCW7465761.1 TolC family protein [Leptospira levettii]MCW7496598.1 TolC family protein [Leptospira levettii]MCW7510499.1 TolC family protein [Leptospira levettii]MCW7514252.1 TolC family protein [Leptospira levettii]TGL71720.1 TolC family protein [Leptospira levettii]